jgi:predicted RNase H-like nuclease
VQHIGIDLAWGEGTDEKPANETGFAVLDGDGRVVDAFWTRGVDETVARLLAVAEPGAVVAVDAPLVIPNETGNRPAESAVARAYGRWQVSANPSNRAMRWQAGVTLRERLEAEGFVYSDGTERPDEGARTLLEVYPYTTIVGMWELGYDRERPRYKRLPPKADPAQARIDRAAACDELIRRVAALAVAETPLDLSTHPETARLLDGPSPTEDVPYKHREDLLDAVLCAWTAAIWAGHPERVQVLGADSEPDEQGRRATIVAPARPEQRPGRPAQPRREEQAVDPLERARAQVRELADIAATLTDRIRRLERDLGRPGRRERSERPRPGNG